MRDRGAAGRLSIEVTRPVVDPHDEACVRIRDEVDVAVLIDVGGNGNAHLDVPWRAWRRSKEATIAERIGDRRTHVGTCD
jgi:hypothetical protein